MTTYAVEQLIWLLIMVITAVYAWSIHDRLDWKFVLSFFVIAGGGIGIMISRVLEALL